MLKMDQVHVLRHKVLKEGQSKFTTQGLAAVKSGPLGGEGTIMAGADYLD